MLASSYAARREGQLSIKVHRNDLPPGLTFAGAVAVDTEALGLRTLRDRLCVVQLSAGDGSAHLVQFDGRDWSAPRLKGLLSDPAVLKIFHFKVAPEPVYCTKIASKLVRTYTDRHGLKDLCSELLGVELSKHQQSSDWAAERLSDQQKQYAANDVLHLHALKVKLDHMLQREGRMAFAEACFRFLPVRAGLDLAGFEDVDIFAH
jgi:ribonuclease D